MGGRKFFSSPGTRTTGTKAGDLQFTGPNWKGSLPSGLKEYKSSTNMVWIIGRTYCSGTPEDYKAVHGLQDQYSIKPLSFYGKQYTPPKGRVDSTIDMSTPVRDQVNKMDGSTFFKKLAELMKDNPPTSEDSAIIERMAKIGIIPGQELQISSLDSKVAEMIDLAPKAGLEKIMAHEKESGKLVNGWTYAIKTGRYGTDYLQRAFVAAMGLGANLPDDAVYPFTTVDNEGKPLSGLNRYVIHFPKGQTPPVRGFWSLTMYNDQYFFVTNTLNRYTLVHETA